MSELRKGKLVRLKEEHYHPTLHGTHDLQPGDTLLVRKVRDNSIWLFNMRSRKDLDEWNARRHFWHIIGEDDNG